MNPSGEDHELLLRHLDGRSSNDDLARVHQLLRDDPDARSFFRQVAEQAVAIGELERAKLGRRSPTVSREAAAGAPMRRMIPINFRAWSWKAAAAAILFLLFSIAAFQLRRADEPTIHVSKVTGSIQFFGADGKSGNGIRMGSALRAGDTLETRSCDAWIELKRADGSTITIAGHSSLRILDGKNGQNRFKLTQGSLWVAPGLSENPGIIEIQTPTVDTELTGSLFDIQATPSETKVRVNDGSARVRDNALGSTVEVRTGHQVSASLGRNEPMIVTEQPSPTSHWKSAFGQVPDVILGRWLPARVNEDARLGADPLLWPISEKESLMLYAVAIAAWKSTDQPVQLHSDSRLRFRGRTDRAHTVRFGFSTQKMRGAFSGKFEIDVPAKALGQPGQAWEAELQLKDFRPLNPQLALSPEGLELTDVYALTVKEDAGLELHHIELIPASE